MIIIVLALKLYKFIIYYTFKNKNRRADIFSKKIHYIETKKIFNYNILKVNKIELLLANKYKLDIRIYIIKDN